MALFGSTSQPSSAGRFTFGTPSGSASAFGSLGVSQVANPTIFGSTSTPSFGAFGTGTTASSTVSVFGTVKSTASSSFGKIIGLLFTGA